MSSQDYQHRHHRGRPRTPYYPEKTVTIADGYGDNDDYYYEDDYRPSRRESRARSGTRSGSRARSALRRVGEAIGIRTTHSPRRARSTGVEHHRRGSPRYHSDEDDYSDYDVAYDYDYDDGERRGRRRRSYHHDDDRQQHRSYSSHAATSTALVRGGGRSKSRRRRDRQSVDRYTSGGAGEDRRRWGQAAEAALTAAAAEAIRGRNDPGPWIGAKGGRVATAALGAAAIDTFVNRSSDPAKHSKRKVVQSTIGGLIIDRVVNGRRSKSRRR